MSNLTQRIERLEQRNPEPGGPSIVQVDGEGVYHVAGETMSQAEFEARWPGANATRLHGFDNV